MFNRSKVYSALLLSGFLLFGARPVSAGWHFGEFRDLEVNIEYFDYAFKLPSGEPVYFIGDTIRYQVTLKNTGNRTFKNFQSKSGLRWLEETSCERWWYDNNFVLFQKDALLPGNSDSGLRDAEIGKQGSTTYEITYFIPWEICPGQAYTRIEGRHKNNSGREEVASFVIPLGVRVQRK